MVPIMDENTGYNNNHNGTILAIFYYHPIIMFLILPTLKVSVICYLHFYQHT